MRKFVSHIVICAMLVLPLQSIAGIGIRIVPTSGYVGDVVKVAVSADATITGQSVKAYQLEISFNNSYLEPVSITSAGTLASEWGDPIMNVVDDGHLKISSAGATSLEGSGVFVYISFRLLRQGTILLSLVINGGFTMLNEGEPAVTVTNGNISIQPKPFITIYPNEGTLSIGDNLQFYTSGGTPPYLYSVSDASVASVNSEGLLTGKKRGLVYVISQDQHGVIDSTNLAVEVVPFKVTLRDTSYYQNHRIDMPLYISSLNVESVKSGVVTLTFNPDILTAESIITTGSLLEGVDQVVSNLSDIGKVGVAFAHPNIIAGKGVLFYIRFKIADRSGGGTTLSITDALINESLKVISDHGYFSIQPLPPLTVTPLTASMLVGEQTQFQASGGTPPYSWSLSDPAVGSILSNGLMTALGGGDVMVHVTDVYGARGVSNVVSVYDAQIVVGELQVSVEPGKAVVPIHISGLPPGKELMSFSGEVAFNSAQIESLGVKKDGSAAASWASAENLSLGLFRFALAGTQPSSGNSLLFSFDIELGDGASVGNVIPVEITNAIANEGSPRCRIDQGKLTVIVGTEIHSAGLTGLRVFNDAANNQVKFVSNRKVIQIQTFDMTGKSIPLLWKSTNEFEGFAHVGNLSHGIYILRFKTLKGESNFKIVLH